MELNIHRLPVNLSEKETALIQIIQGGLPLVPAPYQEIGRQLDMTEQEVIINISRLQAKGIIKRFGVVVRHRELGFRFNAMVVWNIPDERIRELGRCIGKYPFVTLCYQRPRRLPQWPYNLFSMIHGRDRDEVTANVQALIDECELDDIAHELLFSRRRFKQRGARYTEPKAAQTHPSEAGAKATG